MSCVFCNCVIGNTYTVHGECKDCGTPMSGISAVYMGMIVSNRHGFQFHNPVKCSGCGSIWLSANPPCNDDGIDVTEEFNVMFHRKESHWIGGSNAKRKS